MPKQLNVNLAFSADTSKAKAQLADLQNQLTKLTQMTSSQAGAFNIDTAGLNAAVRSAAELKSHLNAAMNTQTGNLDFSKLSSSLQQSGKSLEVYGDSLRQLGPDGQKAFMSLTQAVASSEVPIKKVNASLVEMGTVLKNTIKWQISSSMLHGFMGAISSANRYAQDLNESLNNIRIVTGYSSDKMAEFAEQANKAAKSLSTTTTQYTNASLIYYQQGLSDAEVQKRTDVTIKMANVARQSAEVVSDQLTAIWNNFYDGSKSLEYYADVMTALGAATATSTDEIAGGLEKFAAIGETIGLSYEYAASALATITSNTRQSEEVVGTALKTIFARIQGLNLGETLDDGTTLNKYSEALDTVGISIFESNGELKEMDNILDELGAKWDTIGKAEQTALAQTVAGVRQYTQLIALMENWNNGDSDSMQANLQTSYNASGALDQQAEMYAESWEAARDRVSASAEAIYGKLLDDDMFIGILNGFSEVIDTISTMIDSLGGLKGVLFTIGAVATKVFGQQMAQSISNAAYNLKMMTKSGRESVANEKKNFIQSAVNKISSDTDAVTPEEAQRKVVLTEQLGLQQKMIDNADKMSDMELETNKILMDRVNIMGQESIAAKKLQTEKEKQLSSSVSSAHTSMAQKVINDNPDAGSKKLAAEMQTAYDLFKDLQNNMKKGINFKSNIDTELQRMQKEGKSTQQQLAKIKEEANKLGNSQLDAFINELNATDLEGEGLQETLSQINAVLDASNIADGQVLGLNAAQVQDLKQKLLELKIATEGAEQKEKDFKGAVDGVGNSLDNVKGKMKHWSDGVVALGNIFMSVGSLISSIKGTIDTLQDPDATGWEKFTAVLTGAGTAIMMVTTAFGKQNMASLASLVSTTASTLGFKAFSASAAEASLALSGATGATMGFGEALWTTLWPIGLVMAAIAALVVVIYSAVQAYNADAIAAEKAAKTAEELADANAKVKDSYNQLKSSFDAYDSAKTALDDLVEGTVEWREQLQEVHNTVLDLIEAYPTLLQYNNAIQYDEKTGLIKGVDETYLQMAMDDAANDTAEANAAAIMGKATANQASLKNDATNLSRTIGKQVGISSSNGLIDLGNLQGLSANGSYVNMNQFLSTYSDDLVNLDENAYANKARELSKEFLQNNYNITEQTTSNYEKILSSFTDLLIKNQEEISNLGEAYSKANTEMDNAAKMIVSQEIADDLQKMKEQDRNAVSEATSEMYEAEVKALEKDYKKLLSGKGNDQGEYTFDRNARYDTLDGSVQQIIDKFQEIYNLTNADQDRNFIRGRKENREYYWNTEQFENGVSADFIAQTVAAADALEKCGINANKVAAALAHVDEQVKAVGNVETSTGMGEGVRGFIAEGNFEALNQKEYEAMVSEQFAGEDGKYDSEELLNFLGLSEEEIVKAFGVENIEEALDKWNEALNNVPETLKNVSDTLSKTPKAVFNRLDWSGAFTDMSVKSKKAMADVFQQAFNEAGQTGLDNITTLVNKLGDQSDEFADHLDEIDWSSASPESLIEDMAALGISISEDASPQLQALINYMKQIAGIDLKSAIQNFKDFSSFADSIKQGDSVSKEDYEKIIAANPELAGFFREGVDEYRMMGDTGSFQQAMEGQAHTEYLAYLNQLPKEIEMYEKGLATDYESLRGRAGDATLLDEASQFIGGNPQVRNFDAEKAQSQLDYLKAAGYSDEDTMAEWQNSIKNESMSLEDADALAQAIEDMGDQSDYLNKNLETAKDNLENGFDKLNFSQLVDDIEDVDLDVGEVENYAAQLGEMQKYAGANGQALREMAKDQLRYDRAVENATSNMDSWKDALKDAETTGLLSAETMEQMADTYGDLLDMDPESFSTGFLKSAENLEDMEKALNGSEEAYNKLAKAARKDIALQVGFDNEALESDINNLVELYNDGLGLEDIEVGAALDNEDFLNALSEMVTAAGMTAQQAQDYLSTMGIDAQVVTEPDTSEEVVGYDLPQPTVTNYEHKYRVPAQQGGRPGEETAELPIVTYTPKPIYATKTTQATALRVTSANKSSGGGIKHAQSQPAAAKTRKGSGGGGGGGGSSKAAEPIKLTKHSDIVDRYKEVDDTLDNVRDAFEDVEKITNRLYGVSHISGLKYQNKLLQQEIGLLKDKVKEAKAYLEIDRQELANAAAKAGVSVQFGVEGDITNYTNSMNKLFDELHAAEVYWNNTYQGKTQEDQQKYQEEVLDPIKEKIDDFKDAVSQYDETKELIEDLQNEIDDKFYEWQDNNYETLHYKLEFEIELNDLQLTELEYYLKKLEDDFYSLAEAGQYMSDQIPVWLESLGFHEDFYKGMDGTVDLKQISQLNFVEGTMESIEAIYETLQELNDLDKAMKEYYGKTLEMANEELEGHIDHLEHLTDVLDHYKNIVTMVNGEMDYSRIGTILQGYADSIASELDVLQARYQMLQIEKEAIQTSYNNAANEAEKEIFREELEAITKAVDEAQADMLDKTEDWADAMKAIMENTIAAAGKELEDAFTFNMGFDSLSSSLDRLSSFHEEYLTKANQIYETQKLMRKAQQDADKTENQASKIKLKSFIDETQQLQNKTQMSKLDLEIQQAKYDLLLAQIALEDAQNAKSTVRLQRDNEGNFGYVYTADQEMIGEKEQELADAENALYNIGLEAANNYGNKRLELQQQLADELVALNERRNNGEFETDALYYAERDRIIAEYTNLFTAYSNQYTTALGVDAQIQRDSWIQAYSEMIDNTLLWKDKTTEYLGNCEDAYDEWRNAVVEKGEIINDVLTNTSSNVEKLTNESKELATELQDNLIPLINQELVAVRNITSAYAALREELQKIIEHYEELADQMRDKVEEEAYKDRFEYSREFDTIGEITGAAGQSFEAALAAETVEPGERKKGYASVWNANTNEFEVMDEKQLADYYESLFWLQGRDQNLTGKQIRELAENYAQSMILDEKDLEKALSGTDENWGNLLSQGFGYVDDKGIYQKVEKDKITVENLALGLNAIQTALTHGVSGEEYGKFMSGVTDNATDSITKKYNEYVTNMQNNGAPQEAILSYLEWLDEESGAAEWRRQYNTYLDQAATSNQPLMSLSEFIDAENRRKAEEERRAAEAEAERQRLQNLANQQNSYGTGNYYYVTGGDDPTIQKIDPDNFKDDKSTLSDNTAYYKATQDNKTDEQKKKDQEISALVASSHMSWEEAKKALGYKTGGIIDYTGPAWVDGTPGKPELVLNADDTKNFLAATDMLRTISQTIDLQAMASQVNLNTPPGLFNEYDRALEQMVHIEASFPAVQDRNEIETAFNNLINTAAQYANRKY